jgi:hypothetical protein
MSNRVKLYRIIQGLQNKLNKDSQTFQLECQKAEIKRLEADRDFWAGAARGYKDDYNEVIRKGPQLKIERLEASVDKAEEFGKGNQARAVKAETQVKELEKSLATCQECNRGLLDTMSKERMLKENVRLEEHLRVAKQTAAMQSEWIHENCGADLEGKWITNKQINAAWAYYTGAKNRISPYNDLDLEQIFKEFNIFRCEERDGEERCIDGYLYGVRCPGCYGHKWVWGRENDKS